MNIDYNLYKIFLHLYEEKSISKTANKLYVSQPAISYSLKELENSLGYKLFYRNSKGIEPTLEAKELYNYISTAFNILTDAEEYVKNLNNLNVGNIKIGIPSHIGYIFLTKYIKPFIKEYPKIKFEIISKSMSDMIEMLETRKLDMVIGVISKNTNEKIKKINILKLNNCFAYNKKIFKNIKIKNLEDITKYPLILPDTTTPTRIKLNTYMENKNIILNPIIETTTTEVMFEIVREGIGIGYFLKDAVDMQVDKDDYEIITFNNTLPETEITLAYIDEYLPIASKKFIEKLK
ncbi:MAG: LysR family transcriptional regulator [Bacilli bacterium]|nr:LysR family transcriptional regulator [Bacilli bacterium]